MTSGIPGALNNDIMLEGNNPAPCTTGYESKSNYRQPDSTGHEAAPAKTPYCTVPHSSDQQIRGSHNYPCPNNPSLRSATASGCGLDFGTSGVPTGSSGPGATSAATYDPSNGLLVGPNGLLYSVGAKSLSGNGPTTLQGLLKETLGS
jgi:phospholipid/cholesterol/gamma-HCH transport system substrate-binding protein